MNEILLDIILQLVSGKLIDILTLIVLSLTLFFVVIYTRSTVKLQKTGEKQVKIMLAQNKESLTQRLLLNMPSLNFVTQFTSQGQPCLHVENIGNGAALNVRIKNLEIESVKFKFEKQNLILPSQKAVIFKATPYRKEKVLELNEYPKEIFQMGHEENILKITFFFQDIQGTLYEQTNRCVKGKLSHGMIVPDRQAAMLSEARELINKEEQKNITFFSKIKLFFTNVLKGLGYEKNL